MGEQLHPNWRALATVHFPLKRFIKEGTEEVQKGIHISREKHKSSDVSGHQIRKFYEKLIRNKEKEQALCLINPEKNEINKDNNVQQHQLRTSFQVKNYFRYAMENRVDELKKIDFKGEHINVCDNYGWSALMMASCEGAFEVVEFLLAMGVDKSIKDKTGRSAKDLALKKGHLKIVELLEKNHGGLEVIQEEKTKINEPFYCETCEQNFIETSKSQHYTSTVHQFNNKSNLPANKLQKFNIPPRDKGLQLMVKQGWNKESGLGPSQSGRLYPIKTVIRKQRTGLGIEQEAARVTHFKSYDCTAIQRQSSDYYKKKARNRNYTKREKLREWKRDKRLRNELN